MSQNIFGKRLKELRLERNLTLEQLGNILSHSKQGVGHWETAIRLPPLDVIITLANFFNVSLDYLVGRKSRLFSEPDGMMQYRNLRSSNGTVVEGSFRYSFGYFPMHPGTPFFFVHDAEGDLIEKTQTSLGSFEFLGFVSLINTFFNLGYEISKLETGLHRTDIIVSVKDAWTVMSRYKKMCLGDDGSIALKEYPSGHEDFIANYLNWPSEEKIKFLANY